MEMNKFITLNNGIKMPTLGLGVWQIKQSETARVVSWALESGYCHIDTARIYGNEKGVGEAVKSSDIPREQIFITTKLWVTDFFNAELAYRKSLDRLGLGYADLYLIHWPFPFWKHAWKTLEKLYQQGRIKAIGVSNFGIRQLEVLSKFSAITPAVNQIEFSPFYYRKELLEYCKEKGIALEAYSPLTRAKKFNHPVIKELAQKYAKTAAQIMIHWSLQHGLIVIPKSQNPNRIVENSEVFDFTIDDGDMARLDSLNENFRTGFW